jgi:hypothetical protein
MFDIIEGLKILNAGRERFSLEVEFVEGGRQDIRVLVFGLGNPRRRTFMIPREVIAGGGDEMMFMMEIQKAAHELGVHKVKMRLDFSAPPLNKGAALSIINIEGD